MTQEKGAASKDLDREPGLATDEDQYLTFTVGNGSYGVDILRVREITGLANVTHVPKTPQYIRGVVKLRGTIVPVVDLRLRFGVAPAEPTLFTVIVILTVHDRAVGIIADSVAEVLTIPRQKLQRAPALGGTADMTFTPQIAKVGGKVISLLDAERLLSGNDSAAIQAAVEGA
jgi:purine-binding chemotaxis protein CheW